MKRLKMIFAKSFFNEKTLAYFESVMKHEIDKKNQDLITLAMGEILARIVKTDFYISLGKEKDEFEINRGYRLFDGLPKNLSIKAFKAGLKKKGIYDEKMKDLILCLLLQHRVGLINVIGGSLFELLNEIKPKNIVGLSFVKAGEKTRLEFNKDGSVNIHLIQSIQAYTDTDAEKIVGKAEMVITVSPNRQLSFSELALVFYEGKGFSLSELNQHLVHKPKELTNTHITIQTEESGMDSVNTETTTYRLEPTIPPDSNKVIFEDINNTLKSYLSIRQENENLSEDESQSRDNLRRRLIDYVKYFIDRPVFISDNINILQEIIKELTSKPEDIDQEILGLSQKICTEQANMLNNYINSSTANASPYKIWAYYQYTYKTYTFLHQQQQKKLPNLRLPNLDEAERFMVRLSKQLINCADIKSVKYVSKNYEECKERLELCKQILSTVKETTTDFAVKDEISFNLVTAVTNILSDVISKTPNKKSLPFKIDDFVSVAKELLHTRHSFVVFSSQGSIIEHKEFHRTSVILISKILMKKSILDILNGNQIIELAAEDPNLLRKTLLHTYWVGFSKKRVVDKINKPQVARLIASANLDEIADILFNHYTDKITPDALVQAVLKGNNKTRKMILTNPKLLDKLFELAPNTTPGMAEIMKNYYGFLSEVLRLRPSKQEEFESNGKYAGIPGLAIVNDILLAEDKFNKMGGKAKIDDFNNLTKATNKLNPEAASILAAMAIGDTNKRRLILSDKRLFQNILTLADNTNIFVDYLVELEKDPKNKASIDTFCKYNPEFVKKLLILKESPREDNKKPLLDPVNEKVKVQDVKVKASASIRFFKQYSDIKSNHSNVINDSINNDISSEKVSPRL